MEKSKIEWTNNTYNPIIRKGGGFYCIKISPACKNCYAETMSRRVSAMQGNEHIPYQHQPEYPELELKRGMLAGWKSKRDAGLNFVSSMTDVFGEFVPDEWVFEILDAMNAAPRQIFQVLTKRAERANKLIYQWLELRGLEMLPINIWMGFSTENQQEFSSRILWLIDIPCHTRFVSCEPLLSDINMWPYLNLTIDMRTGKKGSAIDWIIVGGESGKSKSTRPMRAEWAQSIRNQAITCNIPFFFKQWGEYIPRLQVLQYPGHANHEQIRESKAAVVNKEGNSFYKAGKHITGAMLDGHEYKQFPKYNLI